MKKFGMFIGTCVVLVALYVVPSQAHAGGGFDENGFEIFSNAQTGSDGVGYVTFVVTSATNLISDGGLTFTGNAADPSEITIEAVVRGSLNTAPALTNTLSIVDLAFPPDVTYHHTMMFGASGEGLNRGYIDLYIYPLTIVNSAMSFAHGSSALGGSEWFTLTYTVNASFGPGAEGDLRGLQFTLPAPSTVGLGLLTGVAAMRRRRPMSYVDDI